MKDELFRKKNLEKINHPDELNDYIRVANSGVWVLLVSIVILLVGAIVWGIFGQIESTTPSVVYVNNGKAEVFITDKEIDKVQEGMTVRFNEMEAVIGNIVQSSDKVYTGELKYTENVADGVYDADIIRATVKPISFIVN